MNNRLNIFIDEAGSVTPLNGDISSALPFSDNYYIVSLVYSFDNDESIYESIRLLNELKSDFQTIETFHYGPLLRREEPFYKSFTIDEIRSIYFRTARIIAKSKIFYSIII